LISRARCTLRKSDAWSFSPRRKRHSRSLPSLAQAWSEVWHQGRSREKGISGLNPLIRSEIETAAGKEHHDSAISADNYSLNLLGEQQVGPYRCFVAEARPKRKDKYLFEGKLWIDVHDYPVVRIEGHPAKQLSFWIVRADFVRQYQKIDGFWLSQKDQTLVQVRLYGKKILTIDHQDYVVNSGQSKDARTFVPEAAIPLTSSR
jgi:hypothetical protein